ncbi:MAG: trimethylamine methyltransferase, partial [Rhodospirillaceae bacterium]|nr:trimethylamine methyltransferase [Rhodospirillaceae bacterium]
MTEDQEQAGRKGRRGRGDRGGSGARRAQRSQRFDTTPLPYIQRKIPVLDVLSEEGLEIIENNAETIMEEVGIKIVD